MCQSWLFVLLFVFLFKKCLQEVSIPREQGPVSHAYTPLFNGLARSSLRIRHLLLHGVPHHHSRETGTTQGFMSRSYMQLLKWGTGFVYTFNNY